MAAILVSANRVVRRTVSALAASAGVRLRVLEEPEHGADVTGAYQQPRLQSPLLIFDSETAVRARRIASRSHAVQVQLGEPGVETATDLPTIWLPAEEERFLRVLIRAANRALRQARIIEVRGITGGAGATTVALTLAGAGAQAGQETVLVETGNCSPALSLTLGLESRITLGWESLVDTAGRLTDLPHPEALYTALPSWRSVRILAQRPTFSQPGNAAVSDVISILARQPGIIIVDAGTQLGPSPNLDLSAVASITVLVVPRTVAGVVQAHEILKSSAEKRSVVLTRDVGGSLTQRDVKKALPGAVIAEIPRIRRLQARADRGVGLPSFQARYWRDARPILKSLLNSDNATARDTKSGPSLRVVGAA